MKNESARFITAYKRGLGPYWLSLIGTTGVGKTMLARAIYGICGGSWHTWPRISIKLREGEHRWFDDFVLRPELVFVDDLGSGYQTDFLRAKLYELANGRLGKWTVITANLNLEQIADEFDARISSRMLRDHSVVVEVDTTDFSLRERR